MSRKHDPRKVLEGLRRTAVSDERLAEIIRAIEEINASIGDRAEDEDGSLRLPYSSDPTPVEERWQNDL